MWPACSLRSIHPCRQIWQGVCPHEFCVIQVSKFIHIQRFPQFVKLLRESRLLWILIKVVSVIIPHWRFLIPALWLTSQWSDKSHSGSHPVTLHQFWQSQYQRRLLQFVWIYWWSALANAGSHLPWSSAEVASCPADSPRHWPICKGAINKGLQKRIAVHCNNSGGETPTWHLPPSLLRVRQSHPAWPDRTLNLQEWQWLLTRSSWTEHWSFWSRSYQGHCEDLLC